MEIYRATVQHKDNGAIREFDIAGAGDWREVGQMAQAECRERFGVNPITIFVQRADNDAIQTYIPQNNNRGIQNEERIHSDAFAY